MLFPIHCHSISFQLSFSLLTFLTKLRLCLLPPTFWKTTDCDRAGAVCQDSPFISGDGIMFYFLVKKDKGFCILSDSKLHINAHFIGKKKQEGKKLHVGPIVGIMFGSHQLYISSLQIAMWYESVDQMLLQLHGKTISVPSCEGCRSNDTGLVIQQRGGTNKVKVKVEGLFEILVRVVPSPQRNRGCTDMMSRKMIALHTWN